MCRVHEYTASCRPTLATLTCPTTLSKFAISFLSFPSVSSTLPSTYTSTVQNELLVPIEKENRERKKNPTHNDIGSEGITNDVNRLRKHAIKANR